MAPRLVSPGGGIDLTTPRPPSANGVVNLSGFQQAPADFELGVIEALMAEGIGGGKSATVESVQPQHSARRIPGLVLLLLVHKVGAMDDAIAQLCLS